VLNEVFNLTLYNCPNKIKRYKMKNYLLLSILLFVTGCSHFSVNAANCDDIMRNDPNAQNIPQECRDYKAEDADKATYPPGQKPIEVNKDFNIGK